MTFNINGSHKPGSQHFNGFELGNQMTSDFILTPSLPYHIAISFDHHQQFYHCYSCLIITLIYSSIIITCSERCKFRQNVFCKQYFFYTSGVSENRKLFQFFWFNFFVVSSMLNDFASIVYFDLQRFEARDFWIFVSNFFCQCKGI